MMMAQSLYQDVPKAHQYLRFSSYHPMAHKQSVVSTLLKRVATHCSSNSLVQKEKAYVQETVSCNGYPECFLFPLECHQSRKDTEDKVDPRFHVTIQYIQGVSEAVTRILNVQVHSGHSGRSFPIQHIASSSPMLYIRSIVMTVMPIMLVKKEGH